jgi:hypothetical protein
MNVPYEAVASPLDALSTGKVFSDLKTPRVDAACVRRPNASYALLAEDAKRFQSRNLFTLKRRAEG